MKRLLDVESINDGYVPGRVRLPGIDYVLGNKVQIYSVTYPKDHESTPLRVAMFQLKRDRYCNRPYNDDDTRTCDCSVGTLVDTSQPYPIDDGGTWS